MPNYGLQDVPWVEEQLMFLSDTLPDLVNKLNRMKAGLLLALVKDTQVCAHRCFKQPGKHGSPGTYCCIANWMLCS